MFNPPSTSRRVARWVSLNAMELNNSTRLIGYFLVEGQRFTGRNVAFLEYDSKKVF